MTALAVLMTLSVVIKLEELLAQGNPEQLARLIAWQKRLEQQARDKRKR